MSARHTPDHLPDGVRFVAADLATPEGPAQLAAASRDLLLGGVDAVVSTSGGQTRRPGAALALQDAGYLADYEGNLLAAVRLDRALVPAMIEQGGRRHRPRQLGRGPPPGPPPARLRCGQGRPERLLQGPGHRTRPVWHPGQHDPARLVHTERMDERLAQLAAAIVFLVSPVGRYLTGTQLPVDGGLLPTT